MHEGLLWFDNDGKTGLEDKLRRASDHYLLRFGRPANACYVHKDAMPDDERTFSLGNAPLHVFCRRNILPHHFWIGVQEDLA